MFRAVVLIATIVSQIALADNPSIFMVGDVNDTYTGTAFALQTEKGIVTVTNAHICKGNSVLYADGGSLGLKLLIVKAVYTKHDLCLLTPLKGVPALRMSDSYRTGEFASVEGFPDHARKYTSGTVGTYIMSRNVRNIMFIYTGQVYYGNSGSPVLNKNNEVMGVISVLISDTGQGGAVPLEFLKEFIDTSLR